MHHDHEDIGYAIEASGAKHCDGGPLCVACHNARLSQDAEYAQQRAGEIP